MTEKPKKIQIELDYKTLFYTLLLVLIVFLVYDGTVRIIMAINAVIAVWIYKDAEKLGYGNFDKIGMFILGLFFGILVIFAWLSFRKEQKPKEKKEGIVIDIGDIGKKILLVIIFIFVASFAYYFVKGFLSGVGTDTTNQETTTINQAEQTEINVCRPCPSPADWSDCSNGKQTRRIYYCDASTDYKCKSKIESRSCVSGSTDEIIERDYNWQYGDDEWAWTASFPKVLYDYYKEKSRPATRNYAVYATDPYDDELIKSLVEVFEEASEESGYTEYETIGMVVSFVQNLPYTSDSVTTPYDEYPRYPLETLVDNGGDCEDTAILTTVILQEMGYGVVLLELPNHMGLGVRCDEPIGTYFQDSYGYNFCYLETTDIGWDIGQLPLEYQNSKATIHYLVAQPILDIEWNSVATDSDVFKVVYETTIDVTNEGSETAENVQVWVGFDSTTEGKVWNQQIGDTYDIEPSETLNTVATLSVTRGVYTRLHIIVSGDNFLPQEEVSEWITV